MAIHDWTSVEAGIFHAFHHDWITEISRALNHGLLPSDYYALPEQIAYALPPKHALAQYAATGCLNTTFYASAEMAEHRNCVSIPRRRF